MAKVRMYGINNNKFQAEHTSNRREEMRFRKKLSGNKATKPKKGTGGVKCG